MCDNQIYCHYEHDPNNLYGVQASLPQAELLSH